MANFDHWMPLNVGDYLADTMHLSTLQHGIYIRLIMHYWKRRELVGNDRTLAHIAGVSTTSFRRVKGPVLALFTPDDESRIDNLSSQKVNRELRFSHARLDAELAKARSVSETRKAAGKAGSSARWGWQKPSNGDGNPDGNCQHTRARDSTTTAKATDSPPDPPRKRGGERGGFKMRNGFADSAAADLQETHHAQPTNPPPSRPRVVPVPRHPHRRLH